jgi:hypothetical protein
MTSVSQPPTGSDEESLGDRKLPHLSAEATKHRRSSLTVGRSELTVEELKSTGVTKLLVERVDDYEGEIARLKPLEQQLYETKAALAVAEEKASNFKKQKLAIELLTTGGAMAGTGLLSMGKGYFADGLAMTLCLAFGVILIAVSLTAKVVYR